MLTLMKTMNVSAALHMDLAPLISLVATSVITVFGVPLNIFLLVIFIKSATLHTLESSFVANLIVADIFLGVHALVGSIIRSLSFEDKNYEKLLCLGIHIVNVYISSAQLYALCFLTFDRFMKVVYPFRHSRLCTKRNIILVITISHASSVLTAASTGWNFHWDGVHYCIMYYLTTDDILIVYVIFIFCILMAIFGLNLKILLVARRQHKEIMVQSRPTASEEAKATNTRNIGKILGILTLFTFVTYIPTWAYITLLVLDVPIKTSLSDGLAFTSMILWKLNPLVDTLAFLLCRKDIKSCALKLLKARSN